MMGKFMRLGRVPRNHDDAPQTEKGVSVKALSSALTVAHINAANVALQSDFRWVLMLPAMVWLAGLAAFIAEP